MEPPGRPAPEDESMPTETGAATERSGGAPRSEVRTESAEEREGPDREGRHAPDPRRNREESPAIQREPRQAGQVLHERDAGVEDRGVRGAPEVRERVDIERVDPDQCGALLDETARRLLG